MEIISTLITCSIKEYKCSICVPVKKERNNRLCCVIKGSLHTERGCCLPAFGTYGMQKGAFWNHTRLMECLEKEPKVGRDEDQGDLERNRYGKIER